MRLSFVTFFALAAKASASFSPVRVSLQALSSSPPPEEVLDALSATGVLSLTGLPDDVVKSSKTMVALQHDCLMTSEKSLKHKFADGTVRRTLATHTVPGEDGMQPLKHSSDGCERFEQAATVFRKEVNQIVSTFSHRLGEILKVEEPLLQNEASYSFPSFEDVVENGEHLEHFHSYEKAVSSSSDTTIDLHTDQGLFLVFTPGRRSTGDLSEGFFIETQEGLIEEVVFSDDDQLVILLGDGVNQYVNHKIKNLQLRAVPHALKLHANQHARVWYGRMVLPPADAIHPAHGKTFGELRKKLMDSGETHKEAAHLACSHSTSDEAHAMQRMLKDTTCENADELYCWHRCMSVTEQSVSEEVCNAQGLILDCINPRDQIWGKEKHGDYYPGCVATDAELETPFDKLREYPRDETSCEDFESFVALQTFDHEADVGKNAVLQFTLTDSTVKGRLAFDGIFGWLAIGLAGTGGKHKMFNGKILMALRAGGYTPQMGMDLSMDPVVNEYMIDPKQTSFRIWGTPVSSIEATERSGGKQRNLETVAPFTEFDGCFTALNFEVSSFAGQSLNMTGTDELIWAANSVDTFVQYHGPDDRAVFTVNWPKGHVKVDGMYESGGNHDVHKGDDHEGDGTSNAPAPFYWIGLFWMFVAHFLF